MWFAVASTGSRPAWRMTTGTRGKTTCARSPIRFVSLQDESSGGQRNSPTDRSGVLISRLIAATSAWTRPPLLRLGEEGLVVPGLPPGDHVDVVAVRGGDELVGDAVAVRVSQPDRVEAELLGRPSSRDRADRRAVPPREDLHLAGLLGAGARQV